MKFIHFIVFASIMFFTSCGNAVKKYDSFLKAKYERKNFVGQSLQLGEHELFFYDNQRADAPVLLFVHGFGGDGKLTWQKQAMAFKDDYRVIIPDILWFGNSKSAAAPTLESQIEAIDLLIKELNLSKVHLVGISYGGFISLGVAQISDERLASLTIVDSPGVHFSEQDQKEFCERVGVDRIENAFIPENEEEVKRMLEFTMFKSITFTKTIREQIVGTFLSKNPQEQRQMLIDLPTNRSRFKEVTLKSKALILWGEEDQVFLKEEAFQLQKQLGAKLVIFPKAGHSLPVEKANSFNKALESFIEGTQH